MAKETRWQGPNREPRTVPPQGAALEVNWVALAKALAASLVAGVICAQGRSQTVAGSVALAREIVNQVFTEEEELWEHHHLSGRGSCRPSEPAT